MQEGRSKVGVAILLSERLGTFLREWKCTDMRITWIQHKIEGICVTVVQVYALTDDSNPGIKDEFFHKLKETVKNVTQGLPDGCDGWVVMQVLGYCSLVVSNITGSLTHGFHT